MRIFGERFGIYRALLRIRRALLRIRRALLRRCSADVQVWLELQDANIRRLFQNL